MAQEDEYFKKALKEWEAKHAGPKGRQVPRFFWKLPSEEDVLQQKLREEARSTFLQRKSRQLLDNSELKALWVLLDQHQTSPEEQVQSPNNCFIIVKNHATNIYG